MVWAEMLPGRTGKERGQTMRLIRFGAQGEEKPGLWQEGKIVELTSIYPDIPDIGEAFFRGGWLQRLESVTAAGKKMKVRIGPPVCSPSKIISRSQRGERFRETPETAAVL